MVGRGEGFRVRDAKPRRSAEAGHDFLTLANDADRGEPTNEWHRLKMREVSRRGVAAGRAEGKSLCARLAPSSGAQGSNGIQRRKQRPRMDKQEREFRLRGTGNRVTRARRSSTL